MNKASGMRSSLTAHVEKRRAEENWLRLKIGISRTVRRFRHDAQLSQSALAALIDLNQSAVSRLEQLDCTDCSLKTLSRLFDALGYEIELHVVEHSPTPTSDQKQAALPVNPRHGEVKP